MLPVSMYYLFLTVTSVFSNVYLFCMSSFCVVYLMLPVSMYYLLLIVPSVFCNVYLFSMSSFCVVCHILHASPYFLFWISKKKCKSLIFNVIIGIGQDSWFSTDMLEQ